MEISENLKQFIKIRINETISNLPRHQKEWVTKHLVDPKLIKVSPNTEGEYTEEVIQITGDGDILETPYYVYYDETINAFGLICILENNFKWKMGIYGEFSETIEKL